MLIEEQNVDQIITTIRTLHQTTIDQRQCDLTEYLIEFFQFIKQQEQQTNLSNIFYLLTNLLRDYIDRAALKVEFLKAKCLETIYEILTNETNDENNIISILQFVSELLVNSENIQEQFLNFNGYEKIFHFLYHVHTPTMDFINQLLILMTEKTVLQVDDSLTPVDIFVHLINPHITVILIHWIPYLTNTSHQHHIIHSIHIIVSRSLQNKMMACSHDIIYSLIDILFSIKLHDKILLDNIFSILEKLARFSISAKEICHICQLFNENTLFKKQLLRILITAAKHDDPDTQAISSYFDLQRPNSGIILPVIRRWPSISSSALHFSFHCWLRLNHEMDSYPHNARRQIYSFYSDSIGLESFIHNSSIYILVNDRRELAYMEINECDELMDGYWHSLTIIHTAQRPSLFVAAFQAVSTCHLAVYIDGLLKKQTKDFKYVPLINDPISLASVGASSQRPRLAAMNTKNDSLPISTTIAKTMKPIKGLFSPKPKTPSQSRLNPLLHAQNITITEPNSQDTIFGESTSLHGQLACIWILAETLNEAQVKHLHSMGADFCNQHHPITSGDTSMSSTILDLLSTRSLLVYHPLACNGQICIDISGCTSQMNGRLNNGSCLRLRSFSESLLSLGGCPVLYPLFEKFQETDCFYAMESDNASSSSSSNNWESPTDWIIVRKESQKNLSDIDNRLISNPIASIINLLRCILSSRSMIILTEQMTKHYNIELLGQHLNRISSLFIDQQLLIAIQQLIECSRLHKSSYLLTNQFIQYILLDFGLWNKAKYDVRITHLQYIAAVIKDEKKYYRTKFGVQYFLDIIRQHFHTPEEDTDEQKNLRSAIYGIIKYFVQRHIRIEELNALLSSISNLSKSNDIITQELLDFILALIDPPSTSTDTTIGLLCEPNMTESLYTLLTFSNLTSKTKEIALKIIKCLVTSRRVPQQVRTQLRLETNHIGFGGITSDLTPEELTVSMIREILNLIINSDSSIDVDQLNIVLILCSAASLDVRYVAMRKLLTCFIQHPSVCQSYAKCHGWQETLAHFFVKSRRSISMQLSQYLTSSNVSNDVPTTSTADQNVDSSRKNSNDAIIDSSNRRASLMPPQISETLLSPQYLTQERFTQQLDLSPSIDENTLINFSKRFASPRPSIASDSAFTTTSALSDNKETTPEFFRGLSDDFQQNTIGTRMSSLRLSSTSHEDLISLAKKENSTDDFTSMAGSSGSLCQLPRTTTITSIKHLYSDEENNLQSGRLGPEVRQILGWIIGVTSTEDVSFFVPSPTSPEDGGLLEELCETLILTIVMVLWKGITGSDDETWMIRSQIFSALRYLHRDYEFYLPIVYIERRILELSMETCLNDLKSSGAYQGYDRLYRRRMSQIRKTTSIYENNCRELIKIVDDFLSQTTNVNDRITENFINGILPILDTMLICEENGTGDQSESTLVSHDEHWTETSLTGLNILLNLLAHSNISYCGPASVRIHSLLHSRPLNGREEAAYLLSNVSKIFSSISEDEDGEHFGYLIPIMKTIIDKSYEILQMNVQIPNVPLRKATSTALDDFRQYCSSSDSQEWQMFIQRHVEPLAEHYRSMSIKPFHMNMTLWWNNCHEMMMIGIHKRNRQIGEEKLKFQAHIVEQWHQRRRSDQQRILKLAKQRRIHQIYVDQEWQNREKYIYGERGPWWNEQNSKERHWKLSDRENIHRMRCKLIENNDFNKHDEASRLRDNLGVDSMDESRQSLLEESLKNKHLLIQQEILHGNSFDEQELLDIANETQALLLEEKEKMIIGTQCSLITSTSVTDGKLEITNRYIYFFDSTPQKSCEKDFKYPLLWLQDVHLRRYNLRPSALEFFLLNQTNFLINFDKKLRRQIYQKIVSLKLPGMKSVFSNLSVSITPQEILKESKLTEKWVTREISNFEYLMMLNTIAGRTYNDLNQYPIFPWILTDYTSEVLDINDPNIFRDFSKPIGIQNPTHIEEVRLKYESFDDPTGIMKKFHYGTHYSNAASVMHYLIRMEPFTTLHIQLQSGKFDIADRQFHSFQSAWLNIMDSPNEVKELIPEFFYLPEFLVNSNKFDLGKLQISNQIINDVQLPPWAHNSPEEFIRIHRLALESDYVSSRLHEWIDLIFGYKQTGQAAIDALNVFMYCSYEKAVDVDAIDDPVTREAVEGMIQNFGQIPSQLLTEPHPQRQTSEQAALEIESQGRALNIFQNLTHIRAFFVEITPANDKLCDPITFISIPKNQVRSFMQQGIPDTLITVSVSGVIGNNGWQPYDKSLSNFFTFERDPTLQTERNRHIIAAPFSPSLEIKSHLFAVSHDAKFVFSGGHWDWSLRVYSLLKSKMTSSLIHHTDIITCLTLDSTGYILVTGSRDTTCVIWNISLQDDHHLNNLNDQESNSFLTPDITLYGHTSEVTCICVSTELDLVISGSLDGTCNIHTVEHGIYIRTLRPIGDRIVNLQLSNERHILIQTEKDDTHLFLYSINGSLIRTRRLEYKIVDMLLSDQHIVLAVNHVPLLQQTNDTTNKESTSLIAARIVIKDMFDMKTIQTIRLRTHINCLYFTKDFSHLLVGVKDGKLIVLTAEKKSLTKNVTKNN
ncbi:unnamed protein product [Rotaria sp. Silwood1]|nr:unnamed protein product [Rotaria sp. Silwood1]CAF0909070.1 unnamed protein product [Rotaria sp. Silwood1]